MKRAVSVSLGSPGRDSSGVIPLLGEYVQIERRGSGGSIETARQLIRELDGKVDALGLGGTDIYLQAAGRRYYLRDGVRLAREAGTTPIVCGAGLKDSLERLAVEELDSLLEWRKQRVLMVAAVDRFGMAESLVEAGANVRFGDAIYTLNLPLPIHRLDHLALLARTLLPVVRQLPIRWLYPTGKRQESTGRRTQQKHFEWASVIAGDFHFIRRYAPQDLTGKVILTNTTTSDDMEDLRRRGVRLLVTTTPRVNGRSLSTNLLEAALVAAVGRHPLSSAEYRELVATAGLRPQVEELNP